MSAIHKVTFVLLVLILILGDGRNVDMLGGGRKGGEQASYSFSKWPSRGFRTGRVVKRGWPRTVGSLEEILCVKIEDGLTQARGGSGSGHGGR